MDPFEISWEAPEFEYREKTVSWYWLTVIIAVIMLAMAVWKANFLFGFFIVLAEILVLVWAIKEPNLVNFLLNEQGLRIHGHGFYPWEELVSWSVQSTDEAELQEIIFVLHKKFRPALKVLVPRESWAAVKTKLEEVLPQVPHKPSFSDMLEKLLGF